MHLSKVITNNGIKWYFSMNIRNIRTKKVDVLDSIAIFQSATIDHFVHFILQDDPKYFYLFNFLAAYLLFSIKKTLIYMR